MSDRLSLSLFAIEVDGKPTLAFEAKRYSEAEAICGDEALRAKLSLLKSGGFPICGDNALLDVRLAHSDEAAIFCEDFESYIWFVSHFQSGDVAVDGTVH
jgi:hypothetical protein